MGLDDDTPEHVPHERIVLGELTVRDLRDSADEPSYATGSCVIAGTMFQVEALRVTRDEDACQATPPTLRCGCPRYRIPGARPDFGRNYARLGAIRWLSAGRG